MPSKSPKKTTKPRKSPKQKEEERKRVLPLLEAGKTVDQIHRETGIPKISVSMYETFMQRGRYQKAAPVAALAPVAAVAQTDIATELLRAEVRFLNLQVQMLKMQLAHAGVALL